MRRGARLAELFAEALRAADGDARCALDLLRLRVEGCRHDGLAPDRARRAWLAWLVLADAACGPDAGPDARRAWLVRRLLSPPPDPGRRMRRGGGGHRPGPAEVTRRRGDAPAAGDRRRRWAARSAADRPGG